MAYTVHPEDKRFIVTNDVADARSIGTPGISTFRPLRGQFQAAMIDTPETQRIAQEFADIAFRERYERLAHYRNGKVSMYYYDDTEWGHMHGRFDTNSPEDVRLRQLLQEFGDVMAPAYGNNFTVSIMRKGLSNTTGEEHRDFMCKMGVLPLGQARNVELEADNGTWVSAGEGVATVFDGLKNHRAPLGSGVFVCASRFNL